VLLVGSFSSADSIRNCREFFRECGSDANILVGYGLTEAGVGLTMTDPDPEDESVGYLLPGVKAKFWDEDENCFYEPDGKAHTGVLYISTPSLSSGRLDDEVIFELEEIDGEKYLNTNDLFKIREDGALYCIGRANKFFLNEEGVRFDAGLIERAVSAQKGIRSCGLVPEYRKKTHDTAPALYVEAESPGIGGYYIVRKALEQVYITDGMIEKTALPFRCVLTDDIPRTITGKVDVHKITEGNVHGISYRVEGEYENEKLKAIMLIPGGASTCGWGCDCIQ
jgi:acyl-coenzyme A synthetase/AMP-(fatty) acid ligase